MKKLIKKNHVFKNINYVDKILFVLSAASGGLSINSFTSIIEAPVGIKSAIFALIFCLTTRIVKKLLNITRKKMKKHDKILMLAKSKLNSIDTLLSRALIDMDLSHEEFITILNEKDKYEIMMKENLKNKNGESYEIIRFNSIKSKS